MRLIDADSFKEAWNSENIVDKTIRAVIDERPTINPETLPIVQELKKSWGKSCKTVKQQKKELDRRDKVIHELEKQLAKVTAERDAAIEDLKLSRLCDTCKFNDEDFDLPFVNCLSPEVCEFGNKWQWRRLEENRK